MEYIASAIIFGIAMLSEYLISGKNSLLFTKIPMHRVIESVVHPFKTGHLS